MKSTSIFLSIFLFFCLETKAQKPIFVSEDSLIFGKSHMPALTVNIPEVKLDDVLKAWTRELQSGTKSKLLSEKGEMSIFGAKIKVVSPNPINVYSKLMNLDSMLKLTVAFELKKDEYIDKTTGEPDLTNTKNYLKDFAKNQYIEVVKDQVDNEDKKLRDLQKELSSLEKEKTNLQKSIQSENNDIATENGNITIQNNELTALTNELVEQNKQLSSITDEPTKKAKSDYISGLEKKKKKVLNSIESSQNKINKSNNTIDKANLEIPKNDRMQADVSLKIEKQQAVYQTFADKLKTIKSY